MTPPQILYKYRSLNNAVRTHTLRAISHREIWFSSLREFNDPFEARASITMDGTEADWRSEFHCRPPDQSTLSRLIPELEDGVREDAEKIGMLCVSTRDDDILMWSHYAFNHRGVCFGFRTTGDSILRDAQPVEYSDEYPLIDYFRMTKEQRARRMLLTKAGRWQYEKEWRVLHTEGGPGLEVYPVGMLVRLILGCAIRLADRNEIIALASALPQPPSVHQAKRSTSAFALDMCTPGR